ncbi:MAG: primosomal protein N' [Caldilineaceae bacterium]
MLTSEQQRVWETVRTHAFDDGIRHSEFLLHGVTGSGKTEIYLRAIDAALARNRQALVLVPEIALTPQTVARFAGRFPGRVTVIHSELSTGERYDVWRLVRQGEFDIVIGPRSALFAPLARLGLIIIDEEHESSYKQNAEEWGSFTVFYDARAVATQLAAITQSALIMGSATPSMESYYAMQQGRLTLLEMPNRVLGHREHVAREQVEAVPVASVPQGQPDHAEPTVYAELPPVEIVDMRQELRAGNRSIFSRSLSAELQTTLSAGEQAILFLNRRGTATFIMCRDCGAVSECPLCATPLTYHERAQTLICHHCNRRYPIPQTCPECDSKRIKFFGSGTQRVEEYVHQIVPQARVVRWDADSVARKGQHAAILREFVEQRADVKVGTQMIAKGLDLPMVTLVGVVAADVGLYLPDFRSSERTFQLLTQVAGRAGRSARGGRVVVQTYTPEHYAIQAAAQHDYAAFYARELLFREEHGYPPVQRMARLIFWHKNEAKAQAESERMALVLRRRAEGLLFRGDLDILGPAPAFFSRYRGYFRWQILLRAENPSALLTGLDIPFGWRIDIDPVSVL